MTVRPQSPLTIVSRRRLKQFCIDITPFCLAQGVSENSTHTIAHGSGAMAYPEMNSMFRALEVLTNQGSLLAQGSHGGGRSWDVLERYRNLKMFNGDLKDYEEFATKFRSQVAAGDMKVDEGCGNRMQRKIDLPSTSSTSANLTSTKMTRSSYSRVRWRCSTFCSTSPRVKQMRQSAVAKGLDGWLGKG